MLTNWKQLKREYLSMVSTDDTLFYYHSKEGLKKVKEILENRMFNHSITSKEIKMLSFITRNENDLKIALSN